MPDLEFLAQHALVVYFRTKIFSKIIVAFEMGKVKFAKVENFMNKQNCLYWGPKMPYFDILG